MLSLHWFDTAAGEHIRCSYNIPLQKFYYRTLDRRLSRVIREMQSTQILICPITRLTRSHCRDCDCHNLTGP
jgi:hypothetical protein